MYIFQPERFLLNKQIRKFSHFIKGKVLDVGAGTGDRYSDSFDSDEYIRMDIEDGEGIDMVGRAENIPMEDEVIDSVVCTQVFEHLQFPEKSASEIYRVLKKGGNVLITVPQMNEMHEEPHDYFRYTKFGIRDLFERQGFKEVAIDQRGGYFSTLAQIKTRFLIDKYNLYSKPILGRIMSKLFSIYGRYMIWRDSKDKSLANTKHAIGWCFVFKK